ncbi:MAG: hypothetical protein QNK19_09060 [Xanthomonadales bacterium]|nr:hypothetical protein [Xanthomonadales bacterium]
MNKMNLKYGLVALAGLGLSANVSAADLTCNDIEFTPAAFAAYQYVDKACLDVVDRDGGTFAKMTATKVVPPDLAPGVSNFLRFHHADGTQGPRHKTNLPRNFQVMLSGQPVRLADVNEGQDINIYAGQEFWVSLLVVEEVIEEAIVEEIVEEAIIEEIIEEEMEAELPTTAGPLPWLALFGSLFLILGGALRFSRKQ